MIRPFPVWVNQVTAPCDFCCGKVFIRLIEYCIYPISSLCYRMSPQRQLFLVKKRKIFGHTIFFEIFFIIHVYVIELLALYGDQGFHNVIIQHKALITLRQWLFYLLR